MTLVLNRPVDDSGHADPGHPERPDRLSAVLAGVDDLHLGEDLVGVEVAPATRAQLTRVHEESYLDQLSVFCYEGGGDLDQDTYATYRSWSLAQLAAGAGIAVVDELSARGEGVGLVAARPPGHHALRDRAMGFCLLNNVAVAAAELTARGERVLIVDWDVHHGNGTQEIFWNDPDVLYVSTHQSPLFPGSGSPSEVGGPLARGGTLNVPLPPGATGDVVVRALEEVAAPVVERFAPGWVLVSAGFDAHRADPIADLALSAGDFARLARTVAGFAPGPGRLALFLEGGYDLDALRASAAAALGAMLDAGVASEAPTSGGPGRDHVERAGAEHRSALERHHREDEEGS
ncbi:MAG: histone deacetylase [Acidobacteriota bacterium]|nr:histone deacetylase [Acidobacteriota bacterium]